MNTHVHWKEIVSHSSTIFRMTYMGCVPSRPFWIGYTSQGIMQHPWGHGHFSSGKQSMHILPQQVGGRMRKTSFSCSSNTTKCGTPNQQVSWMSPKWSSPLKTVASCLQQHFKLPMQHRKGRLTSRNSESVFVSVSIISKEWHGPRQQRHGNEKSSLDFATVFPSFMYLKSDFVMQQKNSCNHPRR